MKKIIICLCILFMAIGCSSVESLEVKMNKGFKMMEDGEYEEAILIFNEVIEIDPNNANAYEYLANIYSNTGDYNKAISSLYQGINSIEDEEAKQQFWNEINDLFNSVDKPVGETAIISQYENSFIIMGYGYYEGIIMEIQVENNKIAKFNVLSHQETDGIGSVPIDESSTILVGKTKEEILSLSSIEGEIGKIDFYSGATFTTNTLCNAAVLALENAQ